MAEPGADRSGGGARTPERRGVRWYEVLLAAALLVLLAAGVAAAVYWSRDAGGWRGGAAADVFLAAMLAAAAAGLLVFLVYLLTRLPPRRARGGDGGAPEGTVESPAGVRLLGLALLALLFLLTAWIYAPPALDYALAAHLLYPAAFALALVLLFDKAARAWAVKGPGVSLREWLHCDAFAVLLVLGYLNLAANADPERYSALFWDTLHVALFVFAFWLVDRKLTRLRWLAGLAYATLLPVLLFAWRAAVSVTPEEEEAAAAVTAAAAAAAVDPSWWSTPWPFIVLGLVACAVEIVVLAATGRDGGERREHQGGGAGYIVKDAVFFILYGALLIAAA